MHRSIWRRESDSTELERIKSELEQEKERVEEKEAECSEYEERALKAEEKCKEMTRLLEEIKKEQYHELEHGSIVTALKGSFYFGRERKRSDTFALDYADDADIEVFVRDCAEATHRSEDKAQAWIKKLKDQDIMTVGDLRDLHDEDWAALGLTVFASRAIKNMLRGKSSK